MIRRAAARHARVAPLMRLSAGIAASGSAISSGTYPLWTPRRHVTSTMTLEDDFDTPTIGDEFDDEVSFREDTGGLDLPTDGLTFAIDTLIEELYQCKTDALRQFAKTRGITASSKAGLINALLDKAKEEADGDRGLSATRKVLGDVVGSGKANTVNGLRSAWTDDGLEASMIENAAERFIKQQKIVNLHTFVRSQAGSNSAIIRRMLRPYQEDTEATLELIAAELPEFGGHLVDAMQFFNNQKSLDVVSAFAAYLVAFINMSSSYKFTSKVNAHEVMLESGLLRPSVEEGDIELLKNWSKMIPQVVENATERCSAWGEKVSRYWGQEDEGCESTSRSRFLQDINSSDPVDFGLAPSWVNETARQFHAWVEVVRLDIPEIAEAPRTFFDSILDCVTAIKIIRLVFGEDAPIDEFPIAYRRAVTLELEQYLDSPEKVRDVTSKLVTFTQSKTNVVRYLSPEFFDSVLTQMQALAGDEQPEAATMTDSYSALILRQCASSSFRFQRASGTMVLMQRMTEDLYFHFRFAAVYKLLGTKDRQSIRTKDTVNMLKTLSYFEHEFNVKPVSMETCASITVALLYLASRSTGSSQPLIERLSSCTGKEELGVVIITDNDPTRLAQMKTALPPQLTYQSWKDRGQSSESQSAYKMMTSNAVKGPMNSIMLMSQSPIIKALDAISKVPWRISRYMLFVQEAIVREGYGFGKIRPAFYPLHYSALKTGEYNNDRLEKTVINLQQSTLYNNQRDKDWKGLSELRSSRVHYLQAMRQARSLCQQGAIYFPHSLDFRGRMYPLPGRLNHTGSDPFRAMLEHAEGKPLGKNGLYWLKVHLANKMGETKLTFDERAQYVDEHIHDVIQSAESPLSGDRWWQDGAEPLQALMACKEVAMAMQHSRGPEHFESRLPVAVDGSYNGLQHYSAIGRDEAGAALVNLVPVERPADAYTGILKEMLKSITADAMADIEVAQKCLGSGKGMDTDHIKRKTIKRPIMTQVYGVTHYGMSEQITEELEKQNLSHGLWTHTDMKEMSAYLRDKLLESLGVTFRETQLCRQWLNEMASIVWKCQPNDLKAAFMWTTPLGLIVRQPYRVKKEGHLFTPQGYSRIAGAAISPASRKQLSALAPNMIHSLDATHLAMTAIEMQNRGLSMMAVHDSYWTYAGDLPVLSRVLREQFVSLYENYDPLWELKEQWEEIFFFDLRRHGMKLPDPPKRGTLDLKRVLESEYFFS